MNPEDAFTIFRDLLQKFYSLIDEMTTFKDKYGYDFKDAFETMTSSDFRSLTEKDFSPEKMSYVQSFFNDMESMTNGFANFLTYDKSQLLDFRRNLKRAIASLDNIVK